MPPHAPAASATLRHLLLTPGLVRGADARVRPPRIATGVAALDAVLGGGVPRGALTEIVGAASSGRVTVAGALLRAVTARRALAAWVDVPDAFDAPSAEAAGVDLARVLWIRPRAVRHALQATEHVLAADGFVLVVLDLDAACARRAVPASAWMRLARGAVRARAALVVLARADVAGTFAAVRLETERRATRFEDVRPCRVFAGVTSTVHLRKCKLDGRAPVSASIVAAAT
jgi:hypothetical protein